MDIFHRVSIRKYQQRPVEREKVERLLQAAMAAPSAGNQQPWEFYVVENREKLEALSRCSPYAGCASRATLGIVACTRVNCMMPEYAQIDLSIAMENMWLAMEDEGLGGVWLGVAPIEERMQYVEKILGIPDDLRAFALFAVGYPAEARKQQERFDPS